jgi:hypothetical protein
MHSHVSPTQGADGFNCPHCGAYAHQTWPRVQLSGDGQGVRDLPDGAVGHCSRCNQVSVWIDERMVFPAVSNGPPPSPDMPAEIAVDYEEARAILGASPRGACALLRLAVQKLCMWLGEPGENLNTDIKSLVGKGLLPHVQQALDAVRVIGNESVHPGELDMKDDHSTAAALFGAINLVVEQLITAPKNAAALYAAIPTSKAVAIDQRDSQA